MDSLMEINKISKFKILNENQERNNFFCLFNWLDTKLEITEYKNDCVKREDLQKYVITNFDYRYYENIDYEKQILNIYIMFSTKEQDHNQVFKYVQFRD